MYAPTYGFAGQGFGDAQPQPQPPTQPQLALGLAQQPQSAYTPNVAPGPGLQSAPAPQTSHQHQYQLQHQHQLQLQHQAQHHGHQQPQQLQPPQHMMYNPQQPYGGAPQGQSAYGTPSAGLGMGPNPGMVQNNNGMAHMAGNNGIVQSYQTPYSSSPYGPGIPSSASGPPLQQPYMTPTTNAVPYGLNTTTMTPQQQQQRMQPHQISTPASGSQRASPYSGAPHNTPPHTQSPSQYMTPQTPTSSQQHQVPTPLASQPHSQQRSQTPQGQQTPQTPSFPPGTGTLNSSAAMATPMSPGSENRERERVSLLLDINCELLIEVMRIQAEQKKDAAGPDGEKAQSDKKPADRPVNPGPAASGKEFVECMRRLQANLAYLAAIADRSHKPSSQIPPHPAIISAPALSPLHKALTKASPNSSAETHSTVKSESPPDGSKPIFDAKAANGTSNSNDMALGAVGSDAEANKEDRAVTLRALYIRLQTLFPGVDPKKEPHTQSSAASRPNPQKPQGQSQGQGQVMPRTNPAQNTMAAQMMQQQQQQTMQGAQANMTNMGINSGANMNMGMGMGMGMGPGMGVGVPMPMNMNLGMGGAMMQQHSHGQGQMMMPQNLGGPGMGNR